MIVYRKYTAYPNVWSYVCAIVSRPFLSYGEMFKVSTLHKECYDLRVFHDFDAGQGQWMEKLGAVYTVPALLFVYKTNDKITFMHGRIWLFFYARRQNWVGVLQKFRNLKIKWICATYIETTVIKFRSILLTIIITWDIECFFFKLRMQCKDYNSFTEVFFYEY